MDIVAAGLGTCSDYLGRNLRLATGILTGHSQLNRHLSVMGVISDPTCNYCELVKRDWTQQPTSYVNVVTL